MQRLFILLLFFVSRAEGQMLDSIKYENGSLFYHTYGSGNPVIILSGGPGNRCQQIEEVATTIGKTHMAILLEQRGTGLSIPQPMDSTTINLKTALEDINRLLDHLKIKDAIFLGHSWGGTLAMSYAAYFPERVKSLILVGPGFFNADKKFRKTFEISGRARLGEQDLDKADYLALKQKTEKLSSNEIEEQRKIFYKGYIYDKRKMDYLFEKVKTGTRNVLMNTLIWENLDKINFDIKNELISFSKPIFIITGLQDPLAFVSYELKSFLPNSKMYWIQECGHYPMYEQEKEFYSNIHEILDSLK